MRRGIVDFLSGAIYSQMGNILKISEHIYAISPEDVGYLCCKTQSDKERELFFQKN